MAVAGEGIERHVGDDADVRHGLLDRAGRLVDEVVAGEAVGTGLVAQVHLDVREGGKCGNTEVGRFLRRLDEPVDAHAVDARHGGDGIDDVRARHHEDRPDEIVDRQAVLLHETARPIGLAVAPHAAVAGDLVDDVPVGGHDAVSLAWVKHAPGRLKVGDDILRDVDRRQNDVVTANAFSF